MELDLEKAHEIVRKNTPFVGGDSLFDNVAKVVAEGIALGREERTFVVFGKPARIASACK